MNAKEFVRKFGWDEAKRLTDHALKFDEPCIICSGYVDILDLKTLVDAWELVESCGGLDVAIETYNCFKNACDGAGVKHSPKMFLLKQAIELVESCQ